MNQMQRQNNIDIIRAIQNQVKKLSHIPEELLILSQKINRLNSRLDSISDINDKISIIFNDDVQHKIRNIDQQKYLNLQNGRKDFEKNLDQNKKSLDQINYNIKRQKFMYKKIDISKEEFHKKLQEKPFNQQCDKTLNIDNQMMEKQILIKIMHKLLDKRLKQCDDQWKQKFQNIKTKIDSLDLIHFELQSYVLKQQLPKFVLKQQLLNYVFRQQLQNYVLKQFIEKQNKKVNESINILTIQKQQIKKNLQETLKQYRNYAQRLTQQLFQQKEKNQNIQRQLYSPNVANSSIITSTQDYTNLIRFFQPKRVKRLKLIFQASDYEFNLKSYYRKCGMQTNTIIVCRNSQNKVLGGYSPLNFDQQKNYYSDSYVPDKSGESFVFSLTTNQKFPLKNKDQAIYNWRDKQYISFSYDYFWITDRADIYDSGFNFDKKDYDSLNYKNNSASNKKIIGNQSYKFTVTQWEVIKVQFKQ